MQVLARVGNGESARKVVGASCAEYAVRCRERLTLAMYGFLVLLCGFARRVKREQEQVWASILKFHFTGLRRPKQSRQVNAADVESPMVGLLRFCTDVCLSRTVVKRSCGVCGKSAAFRGVQRSTTARGYGCKRRQSSSEHPARPTPQPMLEVTSCSMLQRP